MCKIPPYKLRGGFVGKKQETMMVDPDDGNKQIADGIAQRSGPESKHSRKRRLCWRLQVQNHNGDNHREDSIRERRQPLCWSCSVRHDFQQRRLPLLLACSASTAFRMRVPSPEVSYSRAPADAAPTAVIWFLSWTGSPGSYHRRAMEAVLLKLIRTLEATMH